MKINAKYHRTKDGVVKRNPNREAKHFKRTFKGVEVGISEVGDNSYVWEWTNYGSTQERAAAIDHFDKLYNFLNW